MTTTTIALDGLPIDTLLGLLKGMKANGGGEVTGTMTKTLITDEAGVMVFGKSFELNVTIRQD